VWNKAGVSDLLCSDPYEDVLISTFSSSSSSTLIFIIMHCMCWGVSQDDCHTVLLISSSPSHPILSLLCCKGSAYVQSLVKVVHYWDHGHLEQFLSRQVRRGCLMMMRGGGEGTGRRKRPLHLPFLLSLLPPYIIGRGRGGGGCDEHSVNNDLNRLCCSESKGQEQWILPQFLHRSSFSLASVYLFSTN
jgi:hypothetical protein